MSRLRWPDSTNSVSEKPGTIHDGQPHSEVAAADEGVLIRGPVANVILCLVLGMDPRLHTEIVCCRPYMRRVDQRVFRGRAEQPCTNAGPRHRDASVATAGGAKWQTAHSKISSA